MQTADDEERLFFVQFDLIAGARVGEGSVEPLVERLDRVEHLRQREVEQSPQLGKVVLQRRSCKDETIAGVVVLRERLREFTLRVLHTVTLICRQKISVVNRVETTENIPMIM